MPETDRMRVRTAEVVAALSLATDLGMRAPFEHGLRGTCYAMRLTDALGLHTNERRQVFHICALLYVGCTAELDAVVGAFGDEEQFRLRVAPVAYDMPGRMARVMLSMAGYPAHGPARVVATARTSSTATVTRVATAQDRRSGRRRNVVDQHRRRSDESLCASRSPNPSG